MADARYLADLAQKKKASVAQLLFRCARLLNEWALARVRDETGEVALRAAHTSLLPHLNFEGIRLTDLAARLGVTKQATFQLVQDLEALGLVKKRNDPADGRAKLLSFSRKGERALLDGLRILGGIEREIATAIGRTRFAALHDALLALLPVLEGESKRDAAIVTPRPPRPASRTRPRKRRRRR